MCAAHPSLTRYKGQPVDAHLLENVILPAVFKPGRYLGLEDGAYRKPFAKAKVTMAFAFPDLYEIGISNYGIKLLYSVVNQTQHYLCDRVYAPAQDMMAELRQHNVPLWGVESRVPLKDFDLLAFSLQYELNYTTILGVLESAQIPFRASDRKTLDYPILIAGGPGSGNPMSIAPFFDAFIIGDGEEVLVELLDVIEEGKRKGWDKPTLINRLAQVEGVFIPGVTERATKRIIDIAEHSVEIAPLVPMVAAVHDRVTVEARRGCDRMCRFCQPCFINLPVREQSIENIKKKALEEIEKTGYEECSLLSLSIADYSYFKPMILEVTEALKEHNVSLSLPSQRADRFSLEVAEAVQTMRKSTLTFAPEAGTARMRDVINKNLSDAEITHAVTTAYKAGWNKVKLYFMIGLPTETQADLDGILHTVERLMRTCNEMKRDPSLSLRKHLEVNVTISNFVPKPHTPFQWHPQDTMPELREKIAYLKDKARRIKGLKVNFTDPEISKLEAVISKAGPEMAEVLELAYRKGAYLDAWDDTQPFAKWFEAMTELGFDPEHQTRERLVDLNEPLPWDAIDMGLTKEWLQEEYRRAMEAAATTPCFEACSTCGVCGTYSTWPKFIETPKSEAGQKPKLKVTAVKNDGKVPNLTDELKKPPVAIVRLTIEKKGRLRFVSHLDWLRLVMRAVSRAKLPVAYSQGFNPKPKIAFGPALPLFTEGEREVIDIAVTEPVTGVVERLNKYLPVDGKTLQEHVLPPHSTSITKCVAGMTYTARTTCVDDETRRIMTERIAAVLGEDTLPIEVTSKTATKVFDIRPYLSTLQLTGDDTVVIGFTYPPSSEGNPITLKPDWVLSKIQPDAPEPIRWQLSRTDVVLAP